MVCNLLLYLKLNMFLKISEGGNCPVACALVVGLRYCGNLMLSSIYTLENALQNSVDVVTGYYPQSFSNRFFVLVRKLPNVH